MKRIAILLPLKERFTEDSAGAASIWVKDYLSISSLKKNTMVYGFLPQKKIPLTKNFKNLDLTNFLLRKNLNYTHKFFEEYKKKV